MSARLREVAKQYRKSRLGLIGLVMLFFFVALAALAPVLAPNDPDPLNIVGAPYAAPAWLSPLDPNYFPDTVLIPDPEFNNQDAWNFVVKSGAVEATSTAVGADAHSMLVKIQGSDVKTVAYLETPVKWEYRARPRDVWITYTIMTEAEGNLSTDDVTIYVAYAPEDFTKAAYLVKAVELLINPKYVTDYGIILTRIYAGGGWVSSVGRLNVAEIRAFFSSPTKGTLRVVFEADTRRKSGNVNIYVDKLEFKALSNYYGLLGTSDTGADAWSQLVWGTRMALFVGLLATTVAVSIGIVLGLVAGYFGGAVDEVIMRVVDFLYSIPLLPILLVLAAFLGQNIWNIIMILAIFGWLTTARIIRSQTLSEKAKPYVEAARAAGAGDFYIIFRHILPNVLPLVFVQLTLFVAYAIQLEAALSFLGLGPAEVITWGKMLQFAFETGALSAGAWWYVIPPGLFIALLSMAFIFVGTTLDQILNPRLRRR